MNLLSKFFRVSWIPAFAGMTILLFFFNLSIPTVSAQGLPTTIQGIDLKISTTNPTPGQTITVTAESYVADLNASNITWTLNGSLYQKGVGVSSIEVQAPALGKKLVVAVTAITPEGRNMTISYTISSGNVDLVLEPDSYVPPFYLGKIPLVYQNSYRIIAMPHLADASGKEYDPQSLVYTWTKDSSVVQDQSGYGKQVFSWKDEIVPRQRTIDLKVSSRDGAAQAEKMILLQAGNPFITFYRDDPLYGTLYNVVVKNRISLGNNGEASILAVPFGFSSNFQSTSNLSFSWLLNSVEQESLSANRSITLRAPSDTSGSSNISLTITNNQDIMEKASNSINATFTANSANSSINNFNNSNGI